jgi:hypothetical protein
VVHCGAFTPPYTQAQAKIDAAKCDALRASEALEAERKGRLKDQQGATEIEHSQEAQRQEAQRQEAQRQEAQR